MHQSVQGDVRVMSRLSFDREMEKMEAALLMFDHAAEPYLYQHPQKQNDHSVRTAQGLAQGLPDYDPMKQHLRSSIRDYYVRTSAPDHVAVDQRGTGLAPDQDKISPVPTSMCDSALGPDFDRLAPLLMAEARRQGIAETVCCLQEGINLIGEQQAMTSPERGRGLPRLKCDGYAGPQSRMAFRTCLHRYGAAGMKEAYAMGAICQYLRKMKAGDSGNHLARQCRHHLGPLLRGPYQTMAVTELQELQVMQETLNELANSPEGEGVVDRDKNKGLKVDGDIGPKTRAAFLKALDITGPQGLVRRYGRNLGFWNHI